MRKLIVFFNSNRKKLSLPWFEFKLATDMCTDIKDTRKVVKKLLLRVETKSLLRNSFRILDTERSLFAVRLCEQEVCR